jgi:hypothetical protein
MAAFILLSKNEVIVIVVTKTPWEALLAPDDKHYHIMTVLVHVPPRDEVQMRLCPRHNTLIEVEVYILACIVPLGASNSDMDLEGIRYRLDRGVGLIISDKYYENS